MTSETEKAAPAAAARADGNVCLARYDVTTATWWWSDETYRIHGFEPGEVVPTTALVLAHKHPDDRERVRRTLERAQHTGEPFSIVHRIMDATGHERVVSLAGQGRRDPDSDELLALDTYWVDVTDVVERVATERANQAIEDSARNRATIEQAKGVLAFTYRIDPDAAFEILRGASMETNVPVRVLARGLVAHSSAGELRSGTDVSRYLFGGAAAPSREPAAQEPGDAGQPSARGPNHVLRASYKPSVVPSPTQPT